MGSEDWVHIKQLAEKSLQGDTHSYHAFLSAVSNRLKPQFRRILPENNVDDALQETLVAIHKSLHTLDISKPISPWLNAIARFKIHDQLRALYRNSDKVEYNDDDISFSVKSEIDNNLLLDNILKKLSVREQQIIKLLKIEELSVQEVSDQLKLTPSNVKILTYRALEKLRSIISEEEFL